MDQEFEQALEGLFGGGKKPLDEQLAKAEKSLRKKLKTEGQCSDYMAKINYEAQKFNTALKEMAAAAKDFKDGKIDKKQLKERIKPQATLLKKVGDVIRLGKVVDDNKAVSEEDLKFTQEFIKGLKAIVTKIKTEIKAAPAKEGFTASDVEDLIATCESSMVSLDDESDDAIDFEKLFEI